MGTPRRPPAGWNQVDSPLLCCRHPQVPLHLEPDSNRRSKRFNWQVIGGLLISIACGLVYPVVGPSRTFWLAFSILLLAAALLALARFIRMTRRP